MDPEALRKLGIRWVMLSGEELRSLGRSAQESLERPSPHLELAAQLEGDNPLQTRRIWRVRLVE
jgi:hypothetical protein